jgi:peptidyl-prolyl cis-trans isomerase NIMA-interacting 1
VPAAAAAAAVAAAWDPPNVSLLGTRTETSTMDVVSQKNKSRNPVSRRTGEQVTLTPDEAMAELERYEAKILDEGIGEAFPRYAQQRSDCSSYKHNGDLGSFGRGDMQKSFEDAAFGLAVGEMSGIVSSDSGYHLIYRIE